MAMYKITLEMSWNGMKSKWKRKIELFLVQIKKFAWTKRTKKALKYSNVFIFLNSSITEKNKNNTPLCKATLLLVV
jgi:hypothetical protein